MTHKKPIISVFGSSLPQPGNDDYEVARTMGRALADAGYAVQTGGYQGVMAAASQGASEAGGHVIGVTCTQIEEFRPNVAKANPWIVEEIKCQTLRERLLYLVDNCQGAVIMPGGIGTLSELGLIWSFVQVGEIEPCPLVAFGDLWQQTLSAFITEAYVHPDYQRLLATAHSADEAVKIITHQLNGI